jgi:hypothetical protein
VGEWYPAAPPFDSGVLLLPDVEARSVFPGLQDGEHIEKVGRHMHMRLVVVTQLQHAEAVLQKIREVYAPEICWKFHLRGSSPFFFSALYLEGSKIGEVFPGGS